MFRDACMQGHMDGADVGKQVHLPCIVFLNGLYWGIHNIREKFNSDWPFSNIEYRRPRSATGKWRWILFDLDGSFGCKEWAAVLCDFDRDTIAWGLAEDGATDTATLFSKLNGESPYTVNPSNAAFRIAFKTRFDALPASELPPATVIIPIN
jgi:hypothetical protein